MKIEIKPGDYTHSKSGRMYKVLHTAVHSETLEEMVVYQAQYESEEFGDMAIWVRPATMFVEEVEIDGEVKPRFSRIDN